LQLKDTQLLQAFIITLREGVEAALIVGITLAYLNKIQRQDLRKSVFAALGAAFVASIGVAVLLSRFQLNEDLFEGWVMLLAAFFVVTMIIFMMKTGRKLKGEIESRVDSLASRGSQLGVFLFVFLMVLREGAETVLILSAVSLETSALMSFLGTLLGILAAILFGVMFIKGSVRINVQKFFRVTTVILFFVALQLLISGLHELSEYGVLPSSKKEMALIGPIVSNEWFFFVTILALAALMVLFEARRRQPQAVPGSAAQKRKAQWSARRERLWMASVYATSFLFIVLITAESIYATSLSALSPATPVSISNGALEIPLAQVSNGDLHRFVARVAGKEVRFLLYQKPDGKVVAVFDACEICGPVGFFKGPNGLVCKNCASPINPQSVGTPGGCNPIPLASTVRGDALVIQEADLLTRAKLFER
jgi:high-affinity iron transporter